MVRNALMQGKQVESDVCRALEEVERLSPDVVVVTRGGGSLAELSCFDSRAIAERIARCPYPVLSGIGHEINITVTDLAANVYQKTPTAIARFLVERVEDFLSGMDVRVRAVRESAQSMLECRRQNLGCKSRRFQALLNRFLWSHHRRLMQFSELMRLLPVRVLKQRRADLAVHGKRLRAAPGAFLDFRKKTLANFEKVVRLADPQNILRRGFSVTRAACGRTIRSQRDVWAGEVIVTQVSEGHFKSRVEDDSGPGKEQGGKHGAVKI